MPRLLDRSILYDLTRKWLDVVAAGGSLFQPRAVVWTPASTRSLYEQIVTTPDDKTTKFQPTLLEQARAEGPAGRRLAAEALYVWQLKDSSSSAATKRNQVLTLAEGLTPPVSFPADVEEGFNVGMAAYGPGRLRSLPDYVFVLRLASEWAVLDQETRNLLLRDAWKFREFLQAWPFRKRSSPRMRRST